MNEQWQNAALLSSRIVQDESYECHRDVSIAHFMTVGICLMVDYADFSVESWSLESCNVNYFGCSCKQNMNVIHLFSIPDI